MNIQNDCGSVGLESGTKYVPPKDWDVLTTDEKIERMREVIKNKGYIINNLSNRLARLNEAFIVHKHDVQNGGSLLVPYDRYLGGSDTGALNSEVRNKFF